MQVDIAIACVSAVLNGVSQNAVCVAILAAFFILVAVSRPFTEQYKYVAYLCALALSLACLLVGLIAQLSSDPLLDEAMGYAGLVVIALIGLYMTVLIFGFIIYRYCYAVYVIFRSSLPCFWAFFVSIRQLSLCP